MVEYGCVCYEEVIGVIGLHYDDYDATMAMVNAVGFSKIVGGL